MNSNNRLTNNLSMQRNSSISNVRGLQALGNLSAINPDRRSNCQPLSTSYLYNPMSSPSPFGAAAPPLPPRRRVGAFNHISPMNNYYGSMQRFSPFGYGPSYGGYRMPPYGQFGAPGENYNSFIQMAEESTRPAFESIESVVEVVSSISMMLESTYHAVYSSYSAILGVVDQFSRLKDHLAQIFSILALLRGLRWMCLKILYTLGVTKENPSVDSAWSSAELSSSNQHMNASGENHSSAWPFLVFLGLVIGAPWLMFKLLSKSVSEKPFNRQLFVTENGKMMTATTAYDFSATQHGELSFRAGEKLIISPKGSSTKGWLLACNSQQQTGLIPANYLASKVSTKTNVPLDKSVVQEEAPNTSEKSVEEIFGESLSSNPAAEGVSSDLDDKSRVVSDEPK